MIFGGSISAAISFGKRSDSRETCSIRPARRNSCHDGKDAAAAANNAELAEGLAAVHVSLCHETAETPEASSYWHGCQRREMAVGGRFPAKRYGGIFRLQLANSKTMFNCNFKALAKESGLTLVAAAVP